jgi:Ser/Thr protein kinase RdoA (MazF antagonist)
MALLDDVVDRFGLGRVLPGALDLHGGVNVVTRLPTTTGTYAVHQLLGLASDAEALTEVQRILHLEALAHAGGVALAEPIGGALLEGAAGPVTVHRWVDAAPVDLVAPGRGFFSSLGRSLGRLHAVAPRGMPSPRDALAWHDETPVMCNLDEWDAGADGRTVFSHRDLTPANVLDRDGEAVLIDWESSGPVGTGAEIGRTALDHGAAGTDLVDLLRGYNETSPLPRVGRDWVTLWIRALIVFEHQCRESLRGRRGPAPLLDFQQHVIATHASELARRLTLVDGVIAAFEEAVSAAT